MDENIDIFLAMYQEKDILRFITCGSVDDGKSTLIGRLLYDSRAIFEDHLNTLEAETKKIGTTSDSLDFALLVDGLQSEREQGITIDVAYRYFSTAKRKFIIADTPGHEQYTRNMATGASTADLAIILIDARYGVQLQTKRHSYIVSLLGVKNIIVAVNKMDLVDYRESIFNAIVEKYLDTSENMSFKNIFFIPISALKGDNIVTISQNMTWYGGVSILEMLENIELNSSKNIELRIPIQYVVRPHSDYRAYCGMVANGEIGNNDEITILPSGIKTKLMSLDCGDAKLEHAFKNMSISFTIASNVDIGRSDIVVSNNYSCLVSDALSAIVVCTEEIGLVEGSEYLAKHTTQYIPVKLVKIIYKIDISDYKQIKTDRLNFNEIGLCSFEFSKKIVCDIYSEIKQTGSFILIDKFTNKTIGICMIESVDSSTVKRHNREIGFFEKFLNKIVRKYYPHWETKKIPCS